MNCTTYYVRFRLLAALLVTCVLICITYSSALLFLQHCVKADLVTATLKFVAQGANIVGKSKHFSPVSRLDIHPSGLLQNPLQGCFHIQEYLLHLGGLKKMVSPFQIGFDQPALWNFYPPLASSPLPRRYVLMHSCTPAVGSN